MLKLIQTELSKSPSRRDSCKRCSPSRSKQNTSPGDITNDIDGRTLCQSLHFRQQFWKVFSRGSVSWPSDDQDQLLKACSDKLAELKRKHKLKKLKYAEKATLAVPALFFTERKMKRTSRSFSIAKSFSIKSEADSTSVEEILKKKTITELLQQKDEKIKKNSGKSRKFRKGGIVSLATVNKQNIQDLSNNEELGGENQITKKKKKKKKLNQLRKTVKNAVHTVSLVTITNKKSSKSVPSNKRSSIS